LFVRSRLLFLFFGVTPRREIMDKPRTAPISSALEADPPEGEHTQSTAETCNCQPVDVPGVGPIHSLKCPTRDVKVVEDWPFPRQQNPVSVALRALVSQLDREREHRETLMIQLLFKARNLAAKQIWYEDLNGGQADPYCIECKMGENLGVLRHTASCLTGQVLDVIDALCALPSENNSKKKEEALVLEPEADRSVSADLEQPGAAGDGIRSAPMQQAVEIVRTVVTQLYTKEIRQHRDTAFRNLLVHEEDLISWAKTLMHCDAIAERRGMDASDSPLLHENGGWL
jgi:hypothetical protein